MEISNDFSMDKSNFQKKVRLALVFKILLCLCVLLVRHCCKVLSKLISNVVFSSMNSLFK